MTETAALDDDPVERRNRKDRRIAIALYVVGMLVLFATLAGFLFDQYQRDMQAARERTAARADLVAEWVAGIFSVSEAALTGMTEVLEPPQRQRLFGEPLVVEQAEEFLARRRESLGLIDKVSLIDEGGRVVASSSPLHPPGFDMSGLPFFRLMQAQPSREALVTPLLWSALERRHMVVLLRRLAGGGTVMIQLDPAVFGQTLDDLPFVVVVGEGLDVLLSDWSYRLWVRVMVGLLVMGLGGLVLRHYLNRLRLEEEMRRQARERELARRDARSREARLQALVSSIQDIIFVFDAEGRFTYVHAADPAELMADAASFLQRHYREVLPAPMARQLDEAFETLRRGDGPVEYDYTLHLHGEPRQFHSVLSPLREPGDGAGGALAVVRDVTEERATEAQLRIAATAFETHLGMLITDGNSRILKVNETFTRITGYSEAEVLGRNPRLLSSGLHDGAFYRRLWRSVLSSGSWQGEVWNRRKNGEVFPEWLTLSAVRDTEGKPTHFVATFSDLTERKAAEEEIHQLAFFDPLTGLPNRRLMLDRLEMTLKDSYRSGQIGALIFVDLDHFKQDNDTLGHHAGDQLLREVAHRYEEVLRDTDTLARLGGDEFAVLLHDLGSEPDAVALFQAKAAGRNTLAFFDPEMQVRLQARARLEADLRQALPNDELRLHYQPQVDDRGRPVGVEALVRWMHPVRGQVSPGEFIPLAEENRLIVAIGYWVLEQACRQLAAWAADPARSALSLSVNVSPRQFREPDFVERVLECLETTGAPANRLKLEVTESLFLEGREEARERMLRLREYGVRFSLDDFGTGYSSLAYLKRLPLDQLKIDQSFVCDLLQDEASEAIVASIIVLARSLRLEVVAEGVESEPQRAWLLAHGCGVFQGYLFARPAPLEALELDA